MSASDPYLQPNGVLRNKLGIQDGHEFLAFEKNFVTNGRRQKPGQGIK